RSAKSGSDQYDFNGGSKYRFAINRGRRHQASGTSVGGGTSRCQHHRCGQCRRKKPRPDSRTLPSVSDGGERPNLSRQKNVCSIKDICLLLPSFFETSSELSR